jgi:hypothetical protein
MARRAGVLASDLPKKFFDPEFRGKASFRLRRQRIAASLLDSTILSARTHFGFTDPAARILKSEVDDLIRA